MDLNVAIFDHIDVTRLTGARQLAIAIDSNKTSLCHTSFINSNFAQTFHNYMTHFKEADEISWILAALRSVPQYFLDNKAASNFEWPGYVSLRIIHHLLIDGRQDIMQCKHGAIYIQGYSLVLQVT